MILCAFLASWRNRVVAVSCLVKIEFYVLADNRAVIEFSVKVNWFLILNECTSFLAASALPFFHQSNKHYLQKFLLIKLNLVTMKYFVEIYGDFLGFFWGLERGYQI